MGVAPIHFQDYIYVYIYTYIAYIWKYTYIPIHELFGVSYPG